MILMFDMLTDPSLFPLKPYISPLQINVLPYMYMNILAGIELTFFSGVYGTCISNTKQFGDDAKGLIGISGMFIGVGEILGNIQ